MRNMIFALLVWLGLGGMVQAQQADIQATIDSQFQAFKADDFETAFGFASPTLQRLFQTPENFRSMVTQGYPMVWRPGAVRYLELREQGAAFWQRVMITDQQGRVHILDYRMLETDAGWRINGVQILDSSDFSA
ncbi:DUF4864 domain-containing protein [Roseobacter sp. YSTF-M11]|uniref:DUF4864 domain-containing protein n=1 Tax=Roseobacter insulae TaxID=2859783 RepID=A0A9X1FTH4_9RHOB|nr:DUF4864 domain-containing protein [Roseobacter insulae]MBW4707104.1 DUF4864 domain-containing protein [Roseobacter insulae]